MSLLETRNKKFNLPVVFIVGVIFLIGLAFFANYIENISPSEAVTEVEKEKIIHITVDKNATIFLDGTKIDTIQLEKELKIQFDGHANPVIQLETQQKVSSEKIIKIMGIATKNNYKIILEAVSN
ncbi:biopolymer transport protein ExbD [Kordia periserrulae]|uniref:Biopolymer transport protein ExbD n=1 Tax=Kordia periserrulae TaxID=701523 RepID=A0A2T6BXR7_9FLAO|nr:biopolymer transporter ExbD [Kordia periserrulae]PTX60874.1 biopolymer transport protein ExbD [Kordia periserrulae]